MREVVLKHLAEMPPPLSIAGPLPELVMEILAKEPAKRPGSAEEVAAKLRAIGGLEDLGEPKLGSMSEETTVVIGPPTENSHVGGSVRSKNQPSGRLLLIGLAVLVTGIGFVIGALSSESASGPVTIPALRLDASQVARPAISEAPEPRPLVEAATVETPKETETAPKPQMTTRGRAAAAKEPEPAREPGPPKPARVPAPKVQERLLGAHTELSRVLHGRGLELDDFRQDALVKPRLLAYRDAKRKKNPEQELEALESLLPALEKIDVAIVRRRFARLYERITALGDAPEAKPIWDEYLNLSGQVDEDRSPSQLERILRQADELDRRIDAVRAGK